MPDGGGLFVATSDDMMSFCIEDADFEAMRADLAITDAGEPSVTAIAHPSPTDVAVNHGCFRVAKEDMKRLVSDDRAVVIRDCLEVLQKPSLTKLRDKGMIATDTATGDDVVLTDSCYWLSSGLVRSFVALEKDMWTLARGREVSIFADFMPSQGTADDKDQRRVVRDAPPWKKKIFALMDAVPIRLLALPESKFYHTGTCEEYIEAYCVCRQLARDMNFSRVVHAKFTGGDKANDRLEGVVISSVLPSNLVVPKTTIVEYSVIKSAGVTLGDRSIISGCVVDTAVALPGSHVYHTVPIDDAGDQFVTVAFHIRDDLLKRRFDSVDGLSYGGRGVRQFFPSGKDLLSDDDDICLWHARLFAAADTMEASFRRTLSLVRAEEEGMERFGEARRYSMHDLIGMGNNKRAIMRYRQSLDVLVASTDV